MNHCKKNNIQTTGKWSIYMFLGFLLILDINAVNALENASNPNLIIIDDMRTLNGWNMLPDGNKSSVEISLARDGLNLSYDIRETSSWVDIYKDINFAKIIESAGVSGIGKFIFYYEGDGSPNSFELKLEYKDGATFGYKRNTGTNTNGTLDSFYLNPWQITYWWGGTGHISGETINFDKVEKMRFAVSNDPKRDAFGKGYVIIKQVTAETIPLPLPWYIKYKDYLLAIIALIGTLAGYFIGRKRKFC